MATKQSIADYIRANRPTTVTFNDKPGRIVGLALEWPLFRHDDIGEEDIEISWYLAERLTRKALNESTKQAVS